MRNKTALAALAVGMTTASFASAAVPQLLMSGRIEAIDVASSSLVIEGNKIQSADVRRVLRGQFVNVYGVVNSDGSFSGTTIESASSYALGPNSKVENHATAITGTGNSSQALTGTGSSAQALTGTGVQAEALTGTGMLSQ